jgi:hypothetical protein
LAMGTIDYLQSTRTLRWKAHYEHMFSALPLKADITLRTRYVRFVPTAEVAALFLVSAPIVPAREMGPIDGVAADARFQRAGAAHRPNPWGSSRRAIDGESPAVRANLASGNLMPLFWLVHEIGGARVARRSVLTAVR